MKVVTVSGGVGGSKLAQGLASCLPSIDLTIVVNTADDFQHFGLHISPDLDTVCYTLAGMANQEHGWGRDGETWAALENIERLGGPVWFRLGDQDLGTHLERTRRLDLGEPLSKITEALCSAWGVGPKVLPMTDQRVATLVHTKEAGSLTFQEYFVRLACRPTVSGFTFAGIERAVPAPGVLSVISTSDWVVISPSNPWVSIDPILAVPGFRGALQGKRVIAVSPIIGGKSVRGPAAKMYHELGIEPSAVAVASHYRGLASHFVLDQSDARLIPQVEALGIRSLAVDTVMNSVDDRRRLAQDMLDYMRLAQ